MNTVFALLVSLFVFVVKAVSSKLWKLSYKSQSVAYKMGLEDRYMQPIKFNVFAYTFLVIGTVICLIGIGSIAYSNDSFDVAKADSMPAHVQAHDPVSSLNVAQGGKRNWLVVKGDCFADDAQGDLYPYHAETGTEANDAWCDYGPSATPIATLTKIIKRVIATLTPDITTTQIVTATPTLPTPTNTPSPTSVVTDIPTDTSTQTSTPEPTIVPTNEPTQAATEPAKTKKPACNNGNGEGSDGDHTDGDGAEGCNASDNGNNDETKEKGDKVNDVTPTPAPAPIQQTTAAVVIYAVYALVSKGYWKRIGVGPASDELRGIALTAKGNKLEVKVEIVK